MRKKIEDIYSTYGIRGLRTFIKSTNSLSTKVNRVSQVNIFLRSINESPLEVDEKDTERFKELRQQYLSNRLENKRKLPFSVEGYREIEKELRKKYNPTYALILAGLNSGRRLGELIKGDYKAESEREITLLNPFKKRGKSKAITFPLLYCNSNELLHDIKIFKDSGISLNWVEKKTSQIFKEIEEGFTFHSLRSLYAYYSYELYKPKSNYDFIEWISNVLGHEKSNYTSSMHYNKYESSYTENKELDIPSLTTKEKKRRTFLTKEKEIVKVNQEDLKNNIRVYKENSKRVNTRKSQVESLGEALLKEMGDKKFIVLEAKGVVNLLRKTYKKHYDKDISGRSLKEFCSFFWEEKKPL